MTAPNQGIAIFQQRGSTAAITVSGQGVLNVTGAIYANAAPVNVSGNGQVHLMGNAASGVSARLVCSDLSVSGNGVLTIDASQNAPLGASTAAANTSTSGSSPFAVMGQPLANVPLATFAAVPSATYSASIDWGDGSPAGTGAVTLSGGTLSVSGSHVFNDPGNYQITATLSGSDGSVAHAQQMAVITDVALEADPTNPGTLELAVGGTTGSDTVSVSAGTTAGTVMVTMTNANGTVTEGPFAPTGRIVIYGQSGNHVISIASNVMLPGWIFGGSGNDKLTAGGGPSVLVGGSGNNTLVGGSGRDILIGGAGADSLAAGSGDDLMIAGHTVYDANDVALAAILAEWASGDTLAVRMADILDQSPSATRLNGNYFLLAANANGLPAAVLADTSTDTLVGGSGNDWLFGEFSTGDANADSVIAGTGSVVKIEDNTLA